MKDLQIGDKLLTGRDQSPIQVYAFAHKEPEATAEFLRIHTSIVREMPLVMTGEHLVYVQGKSNPVRADSVRVGDILQGEDDMDPPRVLKIDRVIRKGLYAPLVAGTGVLLVDGIQVSSYIGLQGQSSSEYFELQQGGQMHFLQFSHHDWSHLVLSPFRMVCTAGLSSKLCHTYNDRGMPLYVAWSLHATKWVDSCNVIIQTLAVLVAVFFFGVFWTIESVISHCSATPKVILLVGWSILMSVATFMHHVKVVIGCRAKQAKIV
jgi:Hint module